MIITNHFPSICILSHTISLTKTNSAAIIIVLLFVVILLIALVCFQRRTIKRLRLEISKTPLLSDMSHDIHTPLNAITGYAAIAATNIGNNDCVSDCIHKIRSAGEHLSELINNVLDMSRMEFEKDNIINAPVSISEIISTVSLLVQPQIDSKQLKFSTDSTAVANDSVYADSLKLRQILLNILSNAVKYTNDGGSIDFRIAQQPSDKDGYAHYSFIISDTGVGMSEEFMGKIFLPFERAQTAVTDNIIGTGLGMPIAKKLVELMDGKILVHSVLGKGSTFTVNLDLKLVSKAEPTTPISTQMDISICREYAAEKKVLLAEDNEINQEIAVTLLSEAGFGVDAVSDGQDAVDALINSQPNYYHMVFMDIRMPVMDGYEAARRIRSSDRQDLKEIPLIAMTASDCYEDKQKALEAGMSGYISKPISIEKLIDVIRDNFK